MTRLRLIAEFDFPPGDKIGKDRERFNAAVAKIIPSLFGIPGTLVYLATEIVDEMGQRVGRGIVTGKDREEFEP